MGSATVAANGFSASTDARAPCRKIDPANAGERFLRWGALTKSIGSDKGWDSGLKRMLQQGCLLIRAYIAARRNRVSTSIHSPGSPCKQAFTLRCGVPCNRLIFRPVRPGFCLALGLRFKGTSLHLAQAD